MFSFRGNKNEREIFELLIESQGVFIIIQLSASLGKDKLLSVYKLKCFANDVALKFSRDLEVKSSINIIYEQTPKLFKLSC